MLKRCLIITNVNGMINFLEMILLIWSIYYINGKDWPGYKQV